MTTVNVYPAFGGDCKDAFNFYKSVFGGEFSYIGVYKDMPGAETLPEGAGEKIMHVSLPISKETMLMGCDITDECIRGNNFSICVSPTAEEEARRIFDALSQGAAITMPLDKTFWSPLFGMLTDKFGVHWLVDLATGE